MKFSDYLPLNWKYRDFQTAIFSMPVKIVLQFIALLSLSPFGTMVNIEEKSGTLNFLRFQFPMEVSIQSDIQQSFSEMKDPTSWP